MTININGTLLDLSTPKIMGILNITPDSFYDGGVFNSDKKILNQVEKMINEGVDMIDIGGYSSRPGAKKVNIDDFNRTILGPPAGLTYASVIKQPITKSVVGGIQGDQDTPPVSFN